MAPMLYLASCGLFAGLAVFELRTRNRVAHIQTYLTLLGAFAFCGLFALLLTLATAADGRYASVARVGVLLLTAASLAAVMRMTRRLRQVRSL